LYIHTHTLAAISYPLALYTHTERVSFSFFNRLEGGEPPVCGYNTHIVKEGGRIPEPKRRREEGGKEGGFFGREF
jgi:hypothetical protein